ncbi:thiamine diphosphokinase [Lactobacillus kefiranofaciens subsp. kefirgranum]|uniref:thiamine diphosphokinase n=1 Tax=Lactobacillus kefiranofaciens TaxID=267818 RepID=UPI0006F16DCD|nr:thiamine diphosphokinase [Lactobacillus kefiranofaciens]KRL30650.1 thiamine diphosphokinase [Lactobacillus kefiranofaciens subsp. kefirgranum DSM 10550 = JCM 8572]MDF4141788.1 thiamine diphosphokinase [Lactobacillus kefiranofaciens]URW71797.1 thiamine diphosphokinase [Lactobacillus kefiranofaciens subsp. kefirgranum]URW73746.1 thiamine diphosphokinase [Lactobacillus kefiranofaciens subsp. kefirgranum]
MKAYALLGGPTDLWPQNIQAQFRQAQAQGDLIIGVDRGSLFLEELGIIPDLVVGDFDSLQKKDLAQIENSVADIRYSNPVKDWTDTELMLQTAFRDYAIQNLTIFGATGGRIDHFLTNLWMILNPAIRSFASRLTFIDQQNLIKFFNPGRHTVTKKEIYPYIGFASLTSIRDFNIIGARYKLKNYSSDYPRVFASNEFLTGHEQFEISFAKGMIAAIYSKDVDRFHNLS